MDDPRFAVTAGALDEAAVARVVSAGDEGRDGAVVTFAGVVRGWNGGRRVLRLEYEAYERLAVTVFGRIAGEIAAEWPGARVAIHHRVGTLEVGETSIVIAAVSPHRGEAFAACRYAIERVKQVGPIWKREFHEGGDVWVEGATTNLDDREAREEARRRSCV